MIGAAVVWAAGWGAFGLPWDGAADEPNREVRWALVPQTRHDVVDAARNFVFYIPLGLLLRWFGLSPAASLVIGCALSLTTEAIQLFSSTRIPTLADVLFNTAGVALGAALWRVRARRANL
jgi:VanZ family protein